MPLKLAAVVAALLVVVAACGSGGARSEGITVTDAWIRVTTPDQPAGGYLVITNGSADADALTGVISPAFVSVGLHETVTMSMEPGGSAAGMLGMQPVGEIEVPANGSVSLEPGGFHMMLMEPTGTLAVGDTVELTLAFRKAGSITVTATIKGA